VREVIASYESLVNLFERIQCFLQRLNHYMAVLVMPEMTELLAKICRKNAMRVQEMSGILGGQTHEGAPKYLHAIYTTWDVSMSV